MASGGLGDSERRSWWNDDEHPIWGPKHLGFWLALGAFLAFVSCLGNDFVAWDDPDNFLENRDFRGVGLQNLRWAWTTMLIGVYQPVAWMLLEVQYVLGGLNPYGFHLASALMHALNAVVLYLLTLALVRRCRPGLDPTSPVASLVSALAVALFAIHPMRAEVVAWASAQPYLPCTLFAMLSVLAYLRANPAGQGGVVRSRWLVASFALYAAAVLSKAAAIPLPAVLLVLDAYPLGRLGGERGWWNRGTRSVYLEKLPFFGLGAVFMVAAVVARVYDRNLDPIENTGISGRVALTCYSAWFYPLKTMLPTDLHAYYMRPRWSKLFEPPFLAAIAGSLLAGVLLFTQRRRFPGLVAATAAYLFILAPVSGVVTTGMQLAADRYGYLAMIPWTVAMAVGLCDLEPMLARRRLSGRALATVAAVPLVVLGVLSFQQCRTWRDSEALWAHAIEHGAGHVADLHNNLGAIWASKGHYDLAIMAFHESIRIKPGLKAARDNLDKALRDRNLALNGRRARPSKMFRTEGTEHDW
jgi:hypothetical protein